MVQANLLHKKKKLITQFTLLITFTVIITLILTGFLFAYMISDSLTQEYKDRMFQDSNTTMEDISDSIDIIDSIYPLIVSNDSLYNFMNQTSQITSQSTSQVTVMEKQMTSILIMNNIWALSYLESVYIYTRNNTIHVAKSDTASKQQENLAVYSQLDSSSSSLSLHTLKDSNSLYFVRKIFNNDTGRSIGTIIITVNRDEWINSLSKNIYPGWFIFLYNDDFELLTQHDSELTSQDISDLKNALKPTLVFSTIKINSKDYLTLSNKSSKLDITATVISPNSQITTKVTTVLRSYLIFASIIIFITVLITLGISRVMTHPIKVLIGYINRISQGNYSEKIRGLDTYEEFYSLELAINNMLDQIHSYHDNILEQNLLLKNSEIKALQEQINPHFLFNVLNTLAWKAEMSDNKEVYQMTIAIGEMLKGTIVQKNSFEIAVSDELKYVGFYNYLQKMRFEDRIHIDFQIDEGIDNCKIPCFSVQTLVENAYTHGLEPKETKGELAIIIRKDGDYVSVTVQDNGVGFKKLPDFSDVMNEDADATNAMSYSKKEARGEDINTDAPLVAHTHVGLRNLNKRLYLMYGAESIMHAESVANVRTAISFKIPYAEI